MTVSRLLLGLSALLLSFSIGCGGGSGGSNPPPPPTNPNAQLNGHYTYQLTGLDQLNNPFLPYFEGGVFTADGNGNLSAGSDDFSLAEAGKISNSFTGTYSLASDGTGTITFNIAGGGGVTFKAVIVDSSTLYLSENDGENESSGIAKKQDASAFATPSGTFVFQTHFLETGFSTSSLTISSVGIITVSGGSVTGQADVNDNGTLGAVTLSGSFAAPDVNGRGTATLTDNASNTTNLIYYIQDAGHLFLIPDSTVGTFYGVGQAEKQSAGPFTAASLSGGFAFASDGESALAERVHSAGRFTSAGDGTLNEGVYDSVAGDFIATPFSNISFDGTYTVAANGRADVTFTPAGSPIHKVLWLVSPTRAYVLSADAAAVELGTMDHQSGSFSNATVNGSFGFLDHSRAAHRAGVLTGDGGGGLDLTIFANPGADAGLTGTYAMSSNGRATAAADNLNDGLVFYFTSSDHAYFLTTDPNVGTLSGSIGKIQ
jgi:hypothetical protein